MKFYPCLFLLTIYSDLQSADCYRPLMLTGPSNVKVSLTGLSLITGMLSSAILCGFQASLHHVYTENAVFLLLLVLPPAERVEIKDGCCCMQWVTIHKK